MKVDIHTEIEFRYLPHFNKNELSDLSNVSDSVSNVIDALRDPNLRRNSILQELMTSALQKHGEQVEILPQITSLMPWSLNFAEQSIDVQLVIKFATLKKKVVKFHHLNIEKVFIPNLESHSVFFLTGDDTGPTQDRTLSRIAQDFVFSHYDYALVEIDIGLHINDFIKIFSSENLSDILKIITTDASYHNEDEILSKIDANKAVIFVKGMRFANTNEMSVIEMVLRIISRAKVPFFISTVNKFFNYAVEQVRLHRSDGEIHIVELSPPNKPQLYKILSVKLKLNRKECDEFLAKFGFQMVHGNCFANSNLPIFCELLDSDHEVSTMSNLFSLYETHTAQSITKITAGGENADPSQILEILTIESLKIFGFTNEISSSEQELLQRARFIYKNIKNEFKFCHELVADYLIAQIVVGAGAINLEQKPSTQEILTESRFFQTRKFLDSFLAQNKQDDVEYNTCCATLKSVALKESEIADNLMENICDEGLFHLYQCLGVSPSEEQINSCLRMAIKSDARLASALVKDGANLGAIFDNYPDNGVLHDLAMNGACELMEQARKHYQTLIKTLLIENDIKGCTPLHLAAERGHADMVKLLTQHSASVIQVDNETNNWTALHYAVLNGHS